MLSNKQLEFNKQKFQETNQKYGIFNEELEQFLGDDFYIAPATSNLEMYGAYPGGLLHHLLRSCKYAIQVNTLLPEKLRQKNESIVRVTFLSQIGKVFMFELNKNDWEVKNLGRMYSFKEDDYKLKTGERTLFYLMKYGVKIDENEYHAIVSIDKMEDDKIIKTVPTTLSQIVKIGFNLAILEEKNE